MDHKVLCNVCGKRIFDDYRYKCLVCKNYDLCSSCFEGKKSSHSHSKGHPVVRFNEPNVLFDTVKHNGDEVTLENLEKEFSGEKHPDFKCKSCGQYPIKGLRFSSFNRKKYDLCSSCFKRRDNTDLVVVYGKILSFCIIE